MESPIVGTFIVCFSISGVVNDAIHRHFRGSATTDLASAVRRAIRGKIIDAIAENYFVCKFK